MTHAGCIHVWGFLVYGNYLFLKIEVTRFWHEFNLFFDRWLVSLIGQQFRGNNFNLPVCVIKNNNLPISAATRVIIIMFLILIDIILINPVTAEPIFFYLLNGILFNFTRHN